MCAASDVRSFAAMTRSISGGGAVLSVATHGLTKRYQARTVLADVDLAVPGGCAFGLVGANGAGKTTLMRLLVGLAAADAGTVSVLGRRLGDGRRGALARVGSMIEEPRFHAHLSGRENLYVHAVARGPAAVGRIPAVLDRVGLAERACEPVGRYSMGMRQRLGVARCLLADPELLLLDEPTTGLDPAAIREMRTMVRGMVDEGRTVVISSHLLDEVERTCDHAAILDQGRLVAQGPIGGELAATGAGLEERFLTLTTRLEKEGTCRPATR
jgi:ABC-2 type transport system ATP-binding protein